MKVCISISCPDRYVGGSIYDSFCPRCGKKLYDTAHEQAKRLIESGWYEPNQFHNKETDKNG